MLSDALTHRKTSVPFGTGFSRQFIYIDDVVEALIAALDINGQPHRAYNIASGAIITFDELADLVREILPNADIVLGPGPDPEDYDQRLIDISAAARELAWLPRFDLRHGIDLYVSWLKTSIL